jgi:hypothetical protein
MYDSYGQAQRAVETLETAGFTSSEVSLVSRYRDDNTLADDASGTGAATGATAGALIGGGTGLLTALGIIAIPGLGPLVAAGALATTLAGAAGGSLVGGLLGALTGSGVSEDEANFYAEGVRRGGSVVVVKAEDTRAASAEQILNAEGAVDIGQRRRVYTDEGWSGYDPSAKGMTADEIRRERDRYLRNP